MKQTDKVYCTSRLKRVRQEIEVLIREEKELTQALGSIPTIDYVFKDFTTYKIFSFTELEDTYNLLMPISSTVLRVELNTRYKDKYTLTLLDTHNNIHIMYIKEGVIDKDILKTLKSSDKYTYSISNFNELKKD